MTVYPYAFHRKSRVGGGTVPMDGFVALEANSVDDAIAKVEAMTWPENAVQATIEVTRRSDVVIVR